MRKWAVRDAMQGANASNVRIAGVSADGIGMVVQPGKRPPEAAEIMILSRSSMLPLPGFSAKLTIRINFLCSPRRSKFVPKYTGKLVGLSPVFGLGAAAISLMLQSEISFKLSLNTEIYIVRLNMPVSSMCSVLSYLPSFPNSIWRGEPARWGGDDPVVAEPARSPTTPRAFA